MSRRPAHVSWIHFTDVQLQLLNILDYIGDDGWAPCPRTDEMMPLLLAAFEVHGLPLSRVRVAMMLVGYTDAELARLDWWGAPKAE